MLIGLPLLAAPVGAHTQEPAERPLAIGLSVKERGWVRLTVQATPGRLVRVAERLPDGTETALTDMTMVEASSGRKRLLPWRCDRLQRTVVLTSVAPDGQVERSEAAIRTPRCTGRVSFGRITGRAGRCESGLFRADGVRSAGRGQSASAMSGRTAPAGRRRAQMPGVAAA